MEDTKGLEIAQKPNVSASLGFFQPEQLSQALRIAEQFFIANCFSSDVKNPAQAFVKIQAGAEMGMSPMQAMGSLVIINGKVTLWGAALTQRLREHGWKIFYNSPSGDPKKDITATIEKGGEKYEYTVDIMDNVIQSGQAWKKDPASKLKYHCLARLIRFYVPEVMGVVRYTAEEAEDFTFEPASVEVVNAINVDELAHKINFAETEEVLGELLIEVSKIANQLNEDELAKLRLAGTERKTYFKGKRIEEENKVESPVEELKEDFIDMEVDASNGEVVDEVPEVAPEPITPEVQQSFDETKKVPEFPLD